MFKCWVGLIVLTQNSWDGQMQIGEAEARDSRLWFYRLLLIGLDWLFCCIRKLLGLYSTIIFNIITNSFIYHFKLDISNLYSDLSF